MVCTRMLHSPIASQAGWDIEIKAAVIACSLTAMHKQFIFTACHRCAIGLESPELATGLLVDRKYQPLYESDVWALGQLGLVLAGGSQPEEHIRLQQTHEYMEEMRLGIQDLTCTPGHRACAEYLMALSCHDDSVNYGAQVSCADSLGLHHHALFTVPCFHALCGHLSMQV